MGIPLKTRHYFDCPACQRPEEFRVDHLWKSTPPIKSVGPWFCKGCGVGFMIEMRDVLDIAIRTVSQTRKPAIAILKLRSQDEDIYVALRTHVSDDADHENHRYYYEEHTCPANICNIIDEVYANGETDPHGLFEFVAIHPSDADYNDITEILIEEATKHHV